MHTLIENSIGTLFPGLKLLETEFREMAGGELRPDTIVFDTALDTFVALEYKNRLNKEAVDQARTYLSSMRRHRAELVLSHSKNMKCSPRDQKSFNWKKMYAIIMAPEFGEYQIFGADEDSAVELYEISIYEDSMVLLERVGGGHEQAPSPISDDEIVRADRLYDIIRARMLDKFPGVEEHKRKFYAGFRYPGNKYFCTMALQKSKIWLAYSGQRAASELKADGFVQNVKGRGVGQYRSEIRSEADFERALAILQRLLAITQDVGVNEGGDIDRLYSDASAKLLSAFPGMVREKRNLYDRFSVDGQLRCTMGKQKSKIWLHYSRLTSNPAPDQPEFVTFVEAPGWGTGRYRSAIRSMVDFERALAILKRLHAGGSGGEFDGSHSGVITTNTPGVFNPRYG